jgi:choline/glycine/proline betaine transport protein
VTEETDGDPAPTLREQFFDADVDRDPGEDNVEWAGMDVHPVVFPLSLALVTVAVALTVGLGDRAAAAYQALFTFVNVNFGWFYVLAVNVFIVALLAFGLGKYGTVRLGGPDAETEFSTVSWLAMLFTSGMGVGLLFFGVAEPMFHYRSGGGSFFAVPPKTPAAGRAATAITMFHWGFHPWAIYGIVGLGLSFFAYNRGLPLSFRSIFYPLLGERIFGWPGHLVDLAAVVATVFGLATAAGLGALQITAGLDFLTTTYAGLQLPTGVWATVGIIAVLVGATTLTVLAGLERGIERLSRVNVGLMVALLVLVSVAGPTVFLLDVFNSGLAAYVGNFLELSLYSEAFAGDSAGWQHDWTIFFWGFWIVWAPFVGLFIARISRGRTIREFVTGVLVVPALFSLVWMAAFNGAGLFVELNVRPGGITEPLQDQGQAVALFTMLSYYPLTVVTSLVATANLVTFFVTSADSGALVTSYLTAGGKRDTDMLQRTLWPVVIGITAAVLLLGDGLAALQTAVITTALPFGALIVVMVYTIHRGLRREAVIRQSAAYNAASQKQSDHDSNKPAPPPIRGDE